MAKRVLVTGGAGFIGSHLTNRLLAEGYRVIGVDNLNHYYQPKIKWQNLAQARKSSRFRFYQLDINNLTRLHQVVKTELPEKVVHLAAEVGVRPSFTKIRDYLETNLGGTDNVWQVAKEWGAKQFVFGSSSSVYGKRTPKQGFKETDPVSPISPYGITKQMAELTCQIYARDTGINTTVLRFFTVYGPRNRPDMAAYQFTEAIAGGKPIKLFGRNTKRDFTYIDDVIEGIVRALRRPVAYEVINLGNSRSVTVLKLIRLLEQEIGKKAQIKLLGLPQGDMPVTFANVNKAKIILGWQPKTSLTLGVNKLVTWYKQVHGL